MDNLDETVERQCAAAAVRHLREVHGITYGPIVMVAFAMACAPDVTYSDVLECLAQYVGGFDAQRWHTEICYHLLKSGTDLSSGTEQWFVDRAKEVRDIANRISA